MAENREAADSRGWPGCDVLRWDRRVAESADIPESARRVLVDVGLPAGIDWTLRFEVSDPPRPVRGHLVIGYDGDVPIGVREPSGEVEALETEIGRDAVRFMNSGMPELVRCLGIYLDYRSHVPSLEDEKQIQQYIGTLEARIGDADPTALEAPENYWPVVLEQMRDGLL